MDKYEVKEITNKKTWESFILSRNSRSFLQSWNWGETQKLIGNKIFRIGFYDKNELVGTFLAIKEIAKRGTYLLIPCGPIINWEDRKLARLFLVTIKNLGSKEKAWFIRIRPELLDSEKNRNLFKKLGFISAPMHLHAENTWVLDIRKSDEELLKGMRKTTRYLIRRSININLKVEQTTDPKYSGLLKKLQDETVERHRFTGFSENLFKSQLGTFGEDNQALLFVCKKEREILAAAIIIFYGDTAYYHHSGSTSKYREIPFSYFLQWKIIEEAKKRGLRFYNFWGIAPTDSSKHRFAGVTLFKKGFGGEQVNWLHAQDFPISPFYWLTYLFETGRRIFRRL